MTIYLKQSTASQEVPLGYFVDSTDGDTEETALTIANTDIKVWKNGATTLASKNSGGATHISNGIYYAVLDATDTNTLGPLVLYVHVAGALAVRLECVVLAANVFDSLIGGGDILDVSTTQFNGTNVTATAGRPEVNTTHVAGTAQTARDLGANIDAAITSRMASYTQPTGFLAATFPATVASTTNITTVGAVSGAVGSVTGSVGSVTGLTASNLDATISSRMATYTQPTGFLAATFPTGTIANTTNITAGTITTATNLTNAPTAGDFTSTMKTSIGTAVAASAVASVTGNVGGNVTGSVGSVVGAVGSVTGAVGSVTGAVGSVTGNVGGNVTGSVGSVVAAVGITSNRKKGSAATFTFTMQDSTTGANLAGLTITSTLSKDGAAFAATTNSSTAISGGWYSIVLTATEMNANNLSLNLTATGASARSISIQTQV